MHQQHTLLFRAACCRTSKYQRPDLPILLRVHVFDSVPGPAATHLVILAARFDGVTRALHELRVPRAV